MTTTPPHVPVSPEAPLGGRLVLVDDDPTVLSSLSRALRRAGYEVATTASPQEALAGAAQGDVDAIVTDIHMPDVSGFDLLSSVREQSPAVPVILVSGSVTTDAAMKALTERAYALLPKPCDPEELLATVNRAVRESREQREQREQLEHFARHAEANRERDEARARADREHSQFEDALKLVFMVYQPIVRFSTRRVVGYEALVRSRHPDLSNPALLFQAAHRLKRLNSLAHLIRNLSVVHLAQRDPSEILFINVLPQDLDDPTFAAPDSPLIAHAPRLVLELSEEARVAGDLAKKLTDCRDVGMRVAIDDLGAGYASLNAVAEIEPEVIKLDMVLVRDVHRHPVRQRLVRALVGAALELGVDIVAEGVETREELDCLLALGCDIFQGYLFAKPAPMLAPPNFRFG